MADEAADRMKKKYPGLRVAGTQNGYFQPEEEALIVKQINESGADFLCVALGAPKQERFIAQHRDEFTSVRGAHRRRRQSGRVGGKPEESSGVLPESRSGVALSVYSAAHPL